MNRNKIRLAIIIAAIVIGAGALYGGMKYIQKSNDKEIPFVHIGGTEIPVEVAKTGVQRAKGLSGRDFLEPERGMLFMFSEPDFYSFWMPDMNFPIDIIWIADGKVVGIEENVSNEFDPQNPRFYTPLRPAQYVLEVNAGFAGNHNIGIGDDAAFYHIE